MLVLSTPLVGSLLDLPNTPTWDVIGAAFYHRGSFHSSGEIKHAKYSVLIDKGQTRRRALTSYGHMQKP